MDVERLLLRKLQDLAEFLRVHQQELPSSWWNTCYERLSPEHQSTLERFTPAPRGLKEGSHQPKDQLVRLPKAILDRGHGNAGRKPVVPITSLSTVELPASLKDHIADWKVDPDKLFHQSTSTSGTSLGHSLVEIYVKIDENEDAQAVITLQQRFYCYVFFVKVSARGYHTTTRWLPGGALRLAEALVKSPLLEGCDVEKVSGKVKTFLERGMTYGLWAKELGGPGYLFLLPTEIPEPSYYDRHTRDSISSLADHLRSLGIEDVAEKLKVLDLGDAIVAKQQESSTIPEHQRPTKFVAASSALQPPQKRTASEELSRSGKRLHDNSVQHNPGGSHGSEESVISPPRLLEGTPQAPSMECTLSGSNDYMQASSRRNTPAASDNGCMQASSGESTPPGSGSSYIRASSSRSTPAASGDGCVQAFERESTPPGSDDSYMQASLGESVPSGPDVCPRNWTNLSTWHAMPGGNPALDAVEYRRENYILTASPPLDVQGQPNHLATISSTSHKESTSNGFIDVAGVDRSSNLSTWSTMPGGNPALDTFEWRGDNYMSTASPHLDVQGQPNHLATINSTLHKGSTFNGFNDAVGAGWSSTWSAMPGGNPAFDTFGWRRDNYAPTTTPSLDMQGQPNHMAAADMILSMLDE